MVAIISTQSCPSTFHHFEKITVGKSPNLYHPPLLQFQPQVHEVKPSKISQMVLLQREGFMEKASNFSYQKPEN